MYSKRGIKAFDHQQNFYWLFSNKYFLLSPRKDIPHYSPLRLASRKALFIIYLFRSPKKFT